VLIGPWRRIFLSFDSSGVILHVQIGLVGTPDMCEAVRKATLSHKGKDDELSGPCSVHSLDDQSRRLAAFDSAWAEPPIP